MENGSSIQKGKRKILITGKDAASSWLHASVNSKKRDSSRIIWQVFNSDSKPVCNMAK